MFSLSEPNAIPSPTRVGILIHSGARIRATVCEIHVDFRPGGKTIVSNAVTDSDAVRVARALAAGRS